MKESRRDFIKKTGGCALGMATLATQMHHLGTMSAMAQKAIDASEGGENYKALVLIYWDGGNDSNNMIIPVHNDATVSNYAAYAAARGTQGLALTQAELQNTNIAVPRLGGLNYALHPSLGPAATGAINPGIHELYGTGKLAIVANVGTLVRPLTKAQYQSSAFAKPYQIGSHSDQKAQHHNSISNTQVFTGWGGRLSDRLTPTFNPPGTALVPMVTSISGAQLFTAGQTTLPLAIADSNTNLNSVLNPVGYGTAPTGANAARLSAFNGIRAQDIASSASYIQAASHMTELAMDANAALQVSQDTTVPFPNTGIGRQLRQVARLIKKRLDLNVNRQIFYVQIGGFDTHTGQLAQQVNLYSQFSQALRSFYDEMVTQGVSNDVTTFSLSEFGRTFNPAGSGANVGSDHGWGSHMFVMGGSVLGGNVYGSRRPDATGSGDYFPTMAFAGLDDIDNGTGARGRWLPTTSVDQYAAVFARWFGLPQDAATLEAVFPNLDNFNVGTFPSLGFLP